MAGLQAVTLEEAEVRCSTVAEFWSGAATLVATLHPFGLAAIKVNHGPESHSPWLVYRGEVIDCSSWQHTHPGGRSTIVKAAGGADCAADFDRIHHSTRSKEQLNRLRIGKLIKSIDATRLPAAFRACLEDPEDLKDAFALLDEHGAPLVGTARLVAMAAALNRPRRRLLTEQTEQDTKQTESKSLLVPHPPTASGGSSAAAASPPGGANGLRSLRLAEQPTAMPATLEPPESATSAPYTAYPNSHFEATLVDVRPSVDDGALVKAFSFTVSAAAPRHATTGALDVYPGGHILISIGGGGDLTRPYTPVRVNGSVFTITVKRYDGGVGSSFIHKLRAGDRLSCRGPLLPNFVLDRDVPPTDGPPLHLVAVAAGTGSAPILNIAKAALCHRRIGWVTVVLSFARREDAILVKDIGTDVLSTHQRDRSLKSVVFFTREKNVPPTLEGMPARAGRLGPESLEQIVATCAPLSVRRIGVVCGPLLFNAFVMTAFSTRLGIARDDAYAL